MRKPVSLLAMLILLPALLGVLLQPSDRVAAQGCTPGPGVIDLNFRLDDQGATNVLYNGYWLETVGLHTGDTTTWDGASNAYRLYMLVDLGAENAIHLEDGTTVTIWGSGSTYTFIAAGYTTFAPPDSTGAVYLLNTVGGLTGESTQDVGNTWNEVSYNGVYTRYLIFYVDTFGSAGGIAAVHLEGILECAEPLPDLTRPLAAEDEAPEYSLFNNEESFDEIEADPGSSVAGQFYPLLLDFSPYAVVGISNDPGDPVHAPTDGTVTSVQPLTRDDCGEGQALLAGAWETISVYRPVLGYSACDIGYFRYNGHIIVADVPIENLYIVTIAAESTTFIYVVANAPDYLTTGDVISAGCILGETIPILAFQGISPAVGAGSVISIGAIIEHLFQEPDIHVGFTVASEIIDMETHEPNPSFLDDLTVYPSNDQPCNATPEFTECMGTNPRFLRNGDEWRVNGNTGAYFQVGGGVIINPGSEVYMPMLLDSETEYDVTVGGIDTFGSLSTALLVRVGTAQEIFSLTPGNPVEGRVVLNDVAPTGPIADGVYEVGLKVTGPDPVFVEYACVTPATGTPQVPSACYFANHSFDYDSSGWTAGTSIQFPGGGTAIMLDDVNGTLSQSYNLEAGDYTLSARVRAYYSTEVGLPATPDGDIDLLYDRGGGETTLGSLVFTTFDPGWQVLTTTFTLASPASGTFTFYLDINSGSAELLGLTIDRFCLEKDGGYPGGGGIPPIVNPSCEVVASPNTTDIPSWLSWQWAQFNRFFQCDLMILLNKMYTTFRLQIGTGLSGLRYFIVVTQYSGNWLSNEVFPYLGGHFANIANGRTTTVIESGGGCHDLFCLLDNLISGVLSPLSEAINNIVNFVIWLLTQAAGLIFTLVTSLLGLLVSVLTTIVSLFQTFLAFLQSLVTGLNNATPTPLPGVPQCQLDPQGNPICIALWILENTVFADEGQLYIPLLIGAISIGLIFWAVDTFRKGIGEAVDKL